MIYETIPARYFDNTALFEAIYKAIEISGCVGFLAQDAANSLVEKGMTSGAAMNAGQFINWAKNIEVLTNHWIHLLCEKGYDLRLNLFPLPDTDKLGQNLLDKCVEAFHENKPFKDVINPVYGEWVERLKVLAKNYKIPHNIYRSSMMLNGEAEKICA